MARTCAPLLVLRFERIISPHTESRHPDVPDRDPSFQLVMTGAVKKIREAYRSCGPGSFQTRESRGVAHNVIRQQNFFPPSRLKIAGRGVIQSAKDGNA